MTYTVIFSMLSANVRYQYEVRYWWSNA